MQMPRHRLVLHNNWALGDTVCLSALVRDIHAAYPGAYDIQMTGNYSNVFWRNNPHCVPAKEPVGQLVKIEYMDGIKAAGRGEKIHFLSWPHRDFEKKTGVKVPVTLPKGDIHLTAEERVAKVKGRYWLVVAGGKLDMTAKVWSTVYWQRTVDMLAAQGIRCVQVGGNFRNHFHPQLERVEQLVGQTNNERHFFSLIANAEGVICGITAAMHVAAVFDKPCVVIAGGREEPWWENYSNNFSPTAFGKKCAPVKVEHAFLHTMGLLDCGLGNMTKGCWRDRAIPIEAADHTHPDNIRRLCRKPTRVGQQNLPECMTIITPDHVVEAVMKYYETGFLPPVGTPSKKYSLPLAEMPVEKSIELDSLGTTPLMPKQKLQAAPKLGHLDTKTLPAAWNPSWVEHPPEAKPRSDEKPEFAALDKPYVGGKFTAFILGFGEHVDLVKRCLNSIIDTVPEHRIDIRVALNQPSPAMAQYVHACPRVSQIYVETNSRRKYPAMRAMFHDKDSPIKTDYILWFDDDSWCKDPLWLPKLAETITLNHPQQCRLFGPKYIHDLAPLRKGGKTPDAWFMNAPWWRRRPLYTAGGTRIAPNGSQIPFSSGGFWAMASHVIDEAGIPDERLNHNGGDITIGCQVVQAGYKVCDFDQKKQFVRWSDAPRRGYREAFPWQS